MLIVGSNVTLGGGSWGFGPKLADSGNFALSPQAEINKTLPVRTTAAIAELARRMSWSST
jgi:hypothetical protein